MSWGAHLNSKQSIWAITRREGCEGHTTTTDCFSALSPKLPVRLHPLCSSLHEFPRHATTPTRRPPLDGAALSANSVFRGMAHAHSGIWRRDTHRPGRSLSSFQYCLCGLLLLACCDNRDLLWHVAAAKRQPEYTSKIHCKRLK